MRIDMDRVCEILRTEHHIGNAYVEMTGGGVATIFAGPTRDDDGDAHYAAIAGPGTYGWGNRPSEADTDEFYIGHDDHGDTEPVDMADIAVPADRVEHAVAAIIAAQATKDDPTIPITLVEAMAAADVLPRPTD